MTNRENVFFFGFIYGSVAFVTFWLTAFVVWFLPLVGNDFMVNEVDGWKWFATGVSSLEQQAITMYLIVGLPLVCVLVGGALFVAVENIVRKHKN